MLAVGECPIANSSLRYVNNLTTTLRESFERGLHDAADAY